MKQQKGKTAVQPKKKVSPLLYLRNTWQLYLMMLIPVVYLICFKYKPMLYIVIAFKKYNMFKSVWDADWVGFKYFKEAFGSNEFWHSVWNTVILNLGDLIIGFPFPIFLAIFLNELRSSKIRKVTQVILYLPNFLSWVIIAGISTQIFGGSGLINNLVGVFGGGTIPFLSNTILWRIVYWVMGIWQSAGYSLIIYLAALMGTDPSQSEAAYIDGATRLQRIWHITVPQIMPTISTLLIMQLGKIVNISFDRPYMMSNALVKKASQVLSVYVYEVGLGSGRFDYAAAVGLFQSVIGICMVVLFNQISKKLGQEGIM
jgi:putative aldouronate transport system permease protein